MVYHTVGAKHIGFTTGNNCMKTLAIVGIVVSVFGLLGAFGLITSGDSDGWYALGVYSFFMFQSIMFKNSK